MTDETLETTIVEKNHALRQKIRVEIKGKGEYDELFEEVREAVHEALK